MTVKISILAGAAALSALSLGAAGMAGAAVTTCKPVTHTYKAVHRKVLAAAPPTLTSRVEVRAPAGVRYADGPAYYDAGPGYVYAGYYDYPPPYPVYGYGYPLYAHGPWYGGGWGGYGGRWGGYGHGLRGGYRR